VRPATVLIIALESDLHADAIVHQLNSLGARVARIDPTVDRTLPKEVRIRFGSCTQTEWEFPNGERLCFSSLTGVLCRYAIDKLTPVESSPLVQFSLSEELAAMLAPLRMIEPRRWINDPWLEARADCRILQAHEARLAGLSVPPFVVSSRYSDLIEFDSAQEHGSVIKPISDTPLALVGGKFVEPSSLKTGQFSAPYAAVFAPLDVANTPQVDGTPSLLQARVRKKLDVRATVVDSRVFAAAMPVEPGAPVDFRIAADTQAVPCSLPEGIQRSLVTLVATLRLRFASCDLVVDANEQIYFLEANVSGNWLWTETGANLAISRTIAEALITGFH
jgi:hypothetical protein